MTTATETTTDIIFIIDKSSSMGPLTDDVIAGFNSFISDQRKVEGRAWVTLILFSDKSETIFEKVPLDEVGGLSYETYQPYGNTALLDAMGGAINKKYSEWCTADDTAHPDKTLFVVFTDGYENWSREYDRDKLKAVIQDRTDSEGWDFIYLGANQDSFTEASSIGISGGATADFLSSNVGTQSAMSNFSSKVTSYRMGGIASGASMYAGVRGISEDGEDIMDDEDN